MDGEDFLGPMAEYDDLYPVDSMPSESEPKQVLDDGPGFSVPVARSLAEVEREPVHWLWDGRLPLGKFALIDGPPARGKSTLTVDLAAHLSRNDPLPGCVRPAFDRPASTIVVNVEDGPADTIRPRAEAAGAALEHIQLFEGVRYLRTDDEPVPPMFPAQLSELEALIEATGARLVILDPLVAVLGADAMVDQKVRQAIAPITALADRTGAAIVGVRHLTKTQGAAAMYRGGGSIGLVGAARAALMVAAHPDDETTSVVAPIKSNLGPMPATLTYRIDESPIGCGVIRWTGEAEVTADELVAPADDSEGPTALSEAIDFLGGELADGPQAAGRIVGRATQQGIAKRTLDRAKRELGVATKKRPGPHGQWDWSLEPPQGRQGCQP